MSRPLRSVCFFSLFSHEKRAFVVCIPQNDIVHLLSLIQMYKKFDLIDSPDAQANLEEEVWIALKYII